MPKEPAPRRTQSPILWIALLLAVSLFFLCCGGVSVVTYFVVNRVTDSAGGLLPSITIERPDPDNLENTRAWAASTVKRLKEIESKGDDAATKKEIGKVEQKLKDAFLGKKVRWSFPFIGLHKNGKEVNVDTFFGPDGGPFRGDDPRWAGKTTRKLYFRVFFGNENDGVLIGRDISREQANRLRKGDPLAVKEKVTEVLLQHHDKWWLPNNPSGGVDVLDDFCITLTLERSP
jgi:hypothetical protein